MQCIGNYFHVTSCTIIVLILRDSVLYCGVRSILDLVAVDVVPLAVNLLWLHSFQAVSECNLETTEASAVSSTCVQYCKTSLLSVAVFISQYSTAITNITFSPSVQSHSHTVGLHADGQQCLLLLNTDTFAGWVTGSLHHIVTGIFFSSLVNHKCDPCSDGT